MDKFVPVVGGALFHNEKLLVVKRTADKKFKPNDWEIPGGKVEYGEDPISAIKREFFEETGLKIEVEKPYLTWSYFGLIPDRFCIEVDYLVTCNDVSKITLSAREHSEYKWIAKGEKIETSPEMWKSIEKAFDTIKA